MGTIAKLAVVIAIVLVVVTVLLVRNAVIKLRDCTECLGTIVGFYKSTSAIGLDTGDHKAISPIIMYEVDGVEYKFTGGFCSTSMKVGQSIKILYNKLEHSKAVVKTGVYFAPAIVGLLAATFVICAVLLCMLS